MKITGKEQLQSLSEALLRKDVIIPLIRAMGFQGVTETHGTIEYGKDIVAWKATDGGAIENLAIVAKRTKIIGNEAKETALQTQQAFNEGFEVNGDATLRYANRIWIVSSNEIPEAGRAKIRSIVKDQMRIVTFIDGDELWNLWCHHFPVGPMQFAEEIRTQMRGIVGPLRPKFAIDENAISVSVNVPEKLGPRVEDFPIRANFHFPDTDEGRSLQASFQYSMETGEGLRVSSEHFELEFPAAVGQSQTIFEFLGLSLDQFSTIEILPSPADRTTSVAIEIRAEDGGHVRLPLVEMRVVKAGTNQVTLNNDHQTTIPIRFSLVIRSDDLKGSFSFSIDDGPVEARWLVRWFDLQDCLSSQCSINCYKAEDETRIFTSRSQAVSESKVDRNLRARVIDLANAARVLQQDIYIPDGELSDEDHSAIRRIRSANREPKFETEFDGMTVTLVLRGNEATVDELVKGSSKAIRLEREESVALSGHNVSLGQVRYDMPSVRLGNAEEVVRQLADELPEVTLKLVAAEIATMNVEYLRWAQSTSYGNLNCCE